MNLAVFMFFFGLVWFYGISTIVGYLMLNPVFTYIWNIWFVNTFCRYTQLNHQTILFLTIQVSISQKMLCITNSSIKYQSFSYTQLNDQTVLFQTIQFSTSHLFALSSISNSSIWPMDRTLSGTTTLGQNGPGSNDNEGVLHIPQISKTDASPSDGLVSYPEYLLGKSYPCCRDAAVLFHAPSRLGQFFPELCLWH